MPLPRADILDNIQTLKELEQTDEEREDFKAFFEFYDSLIKKIIDLSDGYKYSAEDHSISEYTLSGQPFGKSALLFFKKSQPLTGLGAALYFVKKRRSLPINMVFPLISDIELSGDRSGQETFRLLNKHFDFIRNKSKKIGNDQRFFFKILFQNLFDPESESHLIFDKSHDLAFKRIRERLEDTWD